MAGLQWAFLGEHEIQKTPGIRNEIEGSGTSSGVTVLRRSKESGVEAGERKACYRESNSAVNLSLSM